MIHVKQGDGSTVTFFSESETQDIAEAAISKAVAGDLDTIDAAAQAISDAKMDNALGQERR